MNKKNLLDYWEHTQTSGEILFSFEFLSHRVHPFRVLLKKSEEKKLGGAELGARAPNSQPSVEKSEMEEICFAAAAVNIGRTCV